MTSINNILEPKKLWLMWQDNTPERKRHKVGILTKDKFEYLSDADLQDAKSVGFKEYPAFPMQEDSVKTYENALSTFISRCPPKNRRDYDVYLRAFGLDPESDDVKNISDFSLLGYTGAFLHGNPFTLVNDYADCDDDFDFILQVSRSKDNYFKYREYTDDVKITLLNKEIEVQPENHPKDVNAVKVLVDKEDLGYVQTGLTKSFLKWIDAGRISEMKITKLNGDVENPNIYAYVNIKKI